MLAPPQVDIDALCYVASTVPHGNLGDGRYPSLNRGLEPLVVAHEKGAVERGRYWLTPS